MKPSKLQYFFASPWLGRIWFTAIPLLFASAMGNALLSSPAPETSWWIFVVGFIFNVVIALLLGYFLAIFPGLLIIRPFYLYLERMNGGPFKHGDTVQILTGPYKGKITRVYSICQSGSLCVVLGAKEKKDGKDVFSPTQLLGEENAEPPAGDDTEVRASQP